MRSNEKPFVNGNKTISSARGSAPSRIDHSSHTFYAALVLAAAVGLPGFWSARWVWGAFIGTFSHVLLDALVHSDVYPMAPWLPGNPMYLGAMEPLSLLLLGLSTWWLLQKTSALLKWPAFRREPSPMAGMGAIAGFRQYLASGTVGQTR